MSTPGSFHDSNSMPFTNPARIIIADSRVAKPFAGTSKNILQIRSFLQSLDVLFSTHNVSSDERQISILASNLTDKALNWYTIFASSHDVKSMAYNQFVEEFKAAFAGQVDSYDVIAKLTNMKQRNNVDGYAREFLQYRNLLPSDAMSESTLINLFVRGLHVDLRKVVRLQPVTTLYDATEVAKRVAHAISNDGGPQLSTPVTPTPDAISLTPDAPTYVTDADGDVVMSIRNSNLSRRSGRRHHRPNHNNRPPQSSPSASSSVNYRDLYRRTCLANNLCFKCSQAGHQSSACAASNPY